MKKKSFIRSFGMLLLLMMCSLALSAQPRAIIRDHLEPAVLVNPGDTLKAEVLNYLNEKGRDDGGWSRGFVYVKNGGSIYVDMHRFSQFDHWRSGETNLVVKLDPVLDQRGSTRKTLYYIDRSGNEQELQLIVIPYNVPMLHSKGAVYELDPRRAVALPDSLRVLQMAREHINAFYEYRITDDRQLNDYITVQDPAQGQTGIDKSSMTIDYRMPTPEAPYDMRRSWEIGGGYDFDKGVSIAQMRAIAQLYPHTEASDLDPNSKGIDSLDFTVCIMSGSIAGASTRHFSYQSGGPGYYTYIRVIDQRRRSYTLSSNIAVLDGYSSGKPYTPAVTAPGKVQILIDGKRLDEARPLYGRKAKVKVDIINDPDELYTIHSVVTKKGKVLYRIGETQIGTASPYNSFRSLVVEYLVSTDEEFIVTLTQARKLVTVRSSDASLGEVAVSTSWEDSFGAVKDSQRAISENRMTLYVKPKANASFVGWKIDGLNQLFSQKTDELTEKYVDFRTDPSRLYYDVLSDGTLRAGVDVKRSLSLTAVFERKAPATATLKVGVSADGSGIVSINGEAQTSITVDQGTDVILEARANKGYVFSHWKNSKGARVGTTAKLTYKVEKDETLIAVFERKASAKATLKVGVSADGSGTVSINGETQTSITVDRGTDVILEARANEGYVFSRWENSKGTRVVTTAKLNYTVEKDETLIAVFDQNTPGVDEVKVLTGQREAILTWDAGSAKSWQIKLYQAGQILGDPIVTQVPRVELGNLSPGQEYRYEIIAIAQGKLDSEAKKATFMTEKFNEAEAITPYLKGFSLFRGGQAFDLIWMDVNPTEFVSETPIYRYYWQATPTSELVPLTPSGKQLTLDANRRGGRLIVRILSGNDQLYEIGYDLNQ